MSESNPSLEDALEALKSAGMSQSYRTVEKELARLRAELAQAREAIDQALDDMSDGGHCVCPETKELLELAKKPAARECEHT